MPLFVTNEFFFFCLPLLLFAVSYYKQMTQYIREGVDDLTVCFSCRFLVNFPNSGNIVSICSMKSDVCLIIYSDWREITNSNQVDYMATAIIGQMYFI